MFFCTICTTRIYYYVIDDFNLFRCESLIYGICNSKVVSFNIITTKNIIFLEKHLHKIVPCIKVLTCYDFEVILKVCAYIIQVIWHITKYTAPPMRKYLKVEKSHFHIIASLKRFVVRVKFPSLVEYYNRCRSIVYCLELCFYIV